MTDNEILLNLSNLLDPIRDALVELKDDFMDVKDDITEIRGDITEIRGDITEIRGDITEIRGDITEMKNDISDMKGRIKKLELTQENVIIPRLDNIESCYLSTYERYKRNVEEYDTMKQDVAIIKRVVAEHSIKLQGIS